METLRVFYQDIKNFFSIPLMTLGNVQLTVWSLIYLLVLVSLLIYVSGKVRRWLVKFLGHGQKLETGAREAIGNIVQYIMLFFGLIIILQTTGIDLTALNVLTGAVGIGVGFGLQNVTNNFISGLIILFERPIKVGDRIEVGSVEGRVVQVRARSTTVVTNDNIAIIVPNSKFISENVINWSYTDQNVRFKIPVSVAYGTDTRLVERLLLEVAKENPDVLERPETVVRFIEFGDSALLFELRVWSTTRIHNKGKLFSDLNFAINDKFNEHGVVIPFPQRDLHVKTGSINIGDQAQDI